MLQTAAASIDSRCRASKVELGTRVGCLSRSQVLIRLEEGTLCRHMWSCQGGHRPLKLYLPANEITSRLPPLWRIGWWFLPEVRDIEPQLTCSCASSSSYLELWARDEHLEGAHRSRCFNYWFFLSFVNIQADTDSKFETLSVKHDLSRPSESDAVSKA